MKGPRLVRTLGVLTMLMLLVVQANPVSAAATRWGSKLTTSVQPQGFVRSCDDDADPPNPNCSWMFRHVYGRTNGHRAPKTGYIDKVRVIACSAGGFYLQFGRVRKNPNDSSKWQAKVRVTSKKVEFAGDPDHCANGVYTINTINIQDVRVLEGEYFGVRTPNPKALRCNSGSPNVLEFTPVLVAGGNYRNASDINGCDPLIELEYRS